MTLAIVIHKGTGRRLRESVGAGSVSVENAATEQYVELPDAAFPPDSTHRWDTQTLTFVLRTANISRSRITREEFVDKWTDAELMMLHQLRIDPASPVLQRARLEAIKERLESRPHVDLANAKVVTAVTWMVGQLANAGVITDTAPARNARIADILAPLTVEESP